MAQAAENQKTESAHRNLVGNYQEHPEIRIGSHPGHDLADTGGVQPGGARRFIVHLGQQRCQGLGVVGGSLAHSNGSAWQNMIGSGGGHRSLLRVGCIREDKDYTENSAHGKMARPACDKSQAARQSLLCKQKRITWKDCLDEELAQT
jgi:hypothetical protein